MPHSKPKSKATAPDPAHHESAIANSKELDRIILFSDAVFAIAITLLVLDIRIPELARDSAAAELPAALGHLVPKFFGFFLSFWMVAAYWMFHHRMCRHLVRYSRGLIICNFVFLMWIAFLPFAAGVFSSYMKIPSAVMLYAGVQAATGFALAGLWLYASHGRRLISATLSESVIRMNLWRALVIPTVYLISIPVTLLVNVDTGKNAWILVAPGFIWVRRMYKDVND